MSPVPKQYEIARHGDLVWSSDALDAGPYRIGSRWFVFSSFGERVREAAVPGHERQREAFHVSRAVFYALRDLTDGRLTQLTDSAVRNAAHAARDLMRARSAKTDTDSFEAAVREKVSHVLGRS